MPALTAPSPTAALSTPATPSTAAAPSAAAAPCIAAEPSAAATPLPSLLRTPPSFLRRQESKHSTALKVSPHPRGRFRGGIAVPPHTCRSPVSAPRSVIPTHSSVIPAQAGIQANRRHSFALRARNGPQTPLWEAVGALKPLQNHEIAWIPAYAGMTEGDAGTAGSTGGSPASNSLERVTRRSRYAQHA